MFDRSIINEIKERLDAVEVIGRYVPLSKAGQRYRALCPFHQEKTPSFYVFPDNGTWRCFGACGTGGDLISFVQKQENLDFAEAIRMLAGMAGVELKQSGDPQNISRRNRLRTLNELAASFFHDQLLHSPQAQLARHYLERRGLTAKTLTDFHIGFAPDSWDHLIRYMQERKVGLDDLELAGLAVRRDSGGAYDRFRNRVIIPIHDVSGRVIGFGGRVLDDSQPKYMNSPQTPLFDKSHIIFALDKAKRAMRAQDQVALVEGYMDVISAHQYGFENVVAAMGTSITPAQLQILAKYTGNLVFALDADAAGISATIRSLHVARETLSSQTVPVPTSRGRMRYEKRLTTSIKIALLPADQDPDDVLRRDPDAWAHLIDVALPLVDFFFEINTKELDMTSAYGKSEFATRMLPLIAEINEPIEQRHYVSKLAIAVGVSEQEIDARLEQYQQRQSLSRPKPAASHPVAASPPLDEPPPDEWSDEPESNTAPPAPASLSTDPFRRIEERILVYLLSFPHLLAWADGALAEMSVYPLTTDDFFDTAHKAIFDAGQKLLYSVAVDDQPSLREQIDEALIPYHDVIFGQRASVAKLREDQLQKDIVDLILRLRKKRTEQAIAELNIQLRDAGDNKQEQHEISSQLRQQIKQLHRLNLAISSRSNSERRLNGKLHRSPT